MEDINKPDIKERRELIAKISDITDILYNLNTTDFNWLDIRLCRGVCETEKYKFELYGEIRDKTIEYLKETLLDRLSELDESYKLT